METAIQFQIEDFSGPLDLLLALVQKNKMSIYDIEILTIIDQYLDIVENAGPEVDMMESSSEFIIMAARLVQMKSTLLLPKSEEAERMREELTGLLVEYSACKEVAAKLREMSMGIFMAVRKPMEIEFSSEYEGRHQPEELAAAHTHMLGRGKMRRAPQRERFDEIVAAPFVSVTGKVISVLRGLVTGKFNKLKQLFSNHGSRSETVATFLAVLELVRGGRLAIDEDESIRLKSSRGAANTQNNAGV